MNWLYLILAILFELVGTSALKACDGFSKLSPSLVSISAYCVAFFFLSLTLKEIPIGIAYAIWSAVGIILVSVFGFFFYKQSLDMPAIIGIGLIISGVTVMNFFSKSMNH